MGNVDTARAPHLELGLAGVAARQAGYRTSVNGASGHVDDRPDARRGGVAWLTIGEGYRETVALALDVDEALGAQTYDARRRPRPHLTVARAVDAAALATLRDFSAGVECAWRTTELVLFRSHLGPGGSRYEALSTFDLAAREPG